VTAGRQQEGAQELGTLAGGDEGVRAVGRAGVCVLGSGREVRAENGHDGGRFVEIGSLTKVLTGTALVRMARAGLLGVDDPVRRWLPVASGTGITLRHLMEHTSGLPRLPPEVWGLSRDPYAGFGPERLRRLVGRLDEVVEHPAGRETVYSNLGYAVLGAALEEAAGEPYPVLLRTHVLEPLGLADEVTADPPTGRLLTARGWFGRTRAPWTMSGAILPAGGLWATPRAIGALVVGLLVERGLGEPAASWQRAGHVRWHNGATRDASVFAGAFDDTGEWVVVHRLGGRPRTTDRLGARLLLQTRPGHSPS
jgi:D-alanyl-D-alanine-carboxypeptidase/D-alanyl-D-alanine-endopeptidase